ncbi:UreD urease accessory protein-domain-containing protein [Cladochytrium replicatum]|nr:UreD urease accessory protein-domain-containing protein [Cladochytrium replicatum]
MNVGVIDVALLSRRNDDRIDEPVDNHNGAADLRLSRAVFQSLRASYPLKFMAPKPRRSHPHRRTVFAITYGGGLVAGDSIQFVINVGKGAGLCVLTQASTKVFKSLPSRSAAPTPSALTPHNHSQFPPHAYLWGNTAENQNRKSSVGASQSLLATIEANGFLAVLPEPVTCFADSTFDQYQTFRLAHHSASLVLLDWFTSGRAAYGETGESWLFKRYSSKNIVDIARTPDDDDDDEWATIVQDAWVLDDSNQNEMDAGKQRHDPSYLPRVAPYTCFASLIFVGPRSLPFANAALSEFESVHVGHHGGPKPQPQKVLWSASPLTLPLYGAVVRAASRNTPDMRAFLSEKLEGMRKEFGEHLFERQL